MLVVLVLVLVVVVVVVAVAVVVVVSLLWRSRGKAVLPVKEMGTRLGLSSLPTVNLLRR